MSKTRAGSGQLAQNLVLQGSAGLTIPSGATLARPAQPNTGEIRFNTNLNVFEGYTGTIWGAIGPVPVQTIDYFTGDGATYQFTLSSTVTDVNAVIVTLNGIQLRNTIDYTIDNGVTLSFVENGTIQNPPMNAADITVRIFGPVSSAGVTAGSISIAELSIANTGAVGNYLSVNNLGQLIFNQFPSINNNPTMGGDLSGTASSATINNNVITLAKMAVAPGILGQVLATDGAGNMAFITVPGIFNNSIKLTPLTAAPTVTEGTIVVANGTTWNPAGKTANVSYPVYFDGTAWHALY